MICYRISASPVKRILARKINGCYYENRAIMTEGLNRSYLEGYPLRRIIPRWIFALLEMGLASSLVFDFGFRMGLFFLIYGFVAIFVVLPLTRCIRCYYYGKACNFGLGKWASFFFPEASEKDFPSAYGYSILLWMLRIVPIGIGIIPFIGAIRNGFAAPEGTPGGALGAIVSGLDFFPQGVFAIYLLVIFLHRKYYRSQSCTRCYHKRDCPVYNKEALVGTFKDLHSVYDKSE